MPNPFYPYTRMKETFSIEAMELREREAEEKMVFSSSTTHDEMIESFMSYVKETFGDLTSRGNALSPNYIPILSPLPEF